MVSGVGWSLELDGLIKAIGLLRLTVVNGVVVSAF